MHQLTLCLLTHNPTKYPGSYQDFLIKAIQGGVTSVQLRDKSATKSDICQLALSLKKVLAPYKIPLILNDHLDIALEVDADGVHLGQNDISPLHARTLLGPDKIVGLSIETYDQLMVANHQSCINYVAASATFASKNKTDCKTVWGLDGLKHLASQSKHPVVAIGGINEHNAQLVMKHGAKGIAVISAIHEARDPKHAAANLIQAIQGEIQCLSPFSP